MRPDAPRVAAILLDVAAREIAPHYRRLAAGAVRTKTGPSDLVTIVDEAAERALEQALAAEAPAAGFIGEESAAADPSVIERLKTEAGCWIVDPLDGTRNFVKGVDEFGTIVAFVRNGVAEAGWICAIPERKVASCIRGGGVIISGASVKPKPQGAGDPTGLRSTGWLAPEWRDRIVGNLKANTKSEPGHCSAYAYLKLVTGAVDFKLSSRIHPWDHAAGALMLEELGGAVRFLDTGEPYRPQESADRPLLATAPGRDWREIAERLIR
jgi:fructose-1,6-bisphosphatase/inositol monophosphatase family enzyme